MPRPSPLTWLPLWQRALDLEIGLRFVVSGVRREYARNTLYEARKASGDPRLEQLIMFLPAVHEGVDYSNEIWICKKEVSIED